MAIRIITDSATDIRKEEAELLGIEVIPMEVRFKDTVYLDGVNLSNEEFYGRLEKESELPKTSQINPYAFVQCFEKIKKANDQAIVILLSSKLSGTYASGKMAGEEYKDTVYVLDSLNVSIGERLLVQLALKLIKEGKSFDEIISILEVKKLEIKFFAKLDTLKYLRKGGRISAFIAFSGEVLNIKPIVGIVNGAVKLLGKGRGISNANKVINKLIIEDGGIDESYPYGTIYSGITNEMLLNYIEVSKNLFPNIEHFPIYPLGATIGTHIGPDAVGVAYFSKKKII